MCKIHLTRIVLGRRRRRTTWKWRRGGPPHRYFNGMIAFSLIACVCAIRRWFIVSLYGCCCCCCYTRAQRINCTCVHVFLCVDALVCVCKPWINTCQINVSRLCDTWHIWMSVLDIRQDVCDEQRIACLCMMMWHLDERCGDFLDVCTNVILLNQYAQAFEDWEK